MDAYSLEETRERASGLLEPRRPGPQPAKSLADRVLAWLTEQLVAGTLRPGQWLSENEIAAHLGVSRSPVRDALREFAQEGLVEVRPRRGTIIAALSAEEAADIFLARELIYSELTRLAVTVMTSAGVDELSSVVDDMRRSRTDPRAWYACTCRWWQTLMNYCPSPTLCDMAAMLWRRSIRFRGILLRMPEQQRDVLAYAEQIIVFARDTNGDGAHAATAELFGRMRQRLLDNVFLQADESVWIERLPHLEN